MGALRLWVLLTSTIPAFAQSIVHSPPRPTRWVLVYAGSLKGSRPKYTVGDFERLLAEVDSAGRPQQWLCTGVIFLHLYAPSGRVFTTWVGGPAATGEDWDQYLDSLFAPGGALHRLDSAIVAVTNVIGPLGQRVPISIMLPYPDPASDSLQFRHQTYVLTESKGRVAALSAYVKQASARFDTSAFPNLRFDGFYWLHETMPNGDTSVVMDVASAVHANGLRLLWVPYFNAQRWDRWKALGFDEAWLQPNYFFDRNLPATRLDTAATRAMAAGMGLEVEFDGRLYADPRFSDRLDPYLVALETHPELRDKAVVLYEGGGGLLRLSRSQVQTDREQYRHLAKSLQ
jgi:hypothetical protein